MGKTALLRRCVSEARKAGAVALYAEASHETSLATLMRRSLETSKKEFASVSDRIKGTLDDALRAIPQASFELPEHLGDVRLSPRKRVAKHEAFRDAIEDLNSAVRKKSRFLVIAIDEIQETPAESMRALIELTHLSAGTDRPILLMGAGLTNSAAHLHEIRTYTERWRYPIIGLLSPEETIAAIQGPATELGVTFEPKALELLVEETAGYPFFVQEYASACWMMHNGDRITRADVERVAPGVRKDLELGYYDNRLRSLSPRETRYILALARLGPGPHSVAEIAAQLGMRTIDVSSIRSQLVKKEVLFVPWNGVVEFRMPLAERYVERHRPELEQRATIFGQADPSAT